jgi:excisionase family DNA binding protein
MNGNGQLEDLQARVEALEHERAEQRESSGWLDAKGAAAHLGLSVKAVYNAIKDDGLPAHRAPNGRWLFKRDELNEWVVRGES